MSPLSEMFADEFLLEIGILITNSQIAGFP
jgi:hypothetical protein